MYIKHTHIVKGPDVLYIKPTPIAYSRVGVGIMRQHQLWVSYFTTIYRHCHFA